MKPVVDGVQPAVTPRATGRDQRIHIRFDKLFPVLIGSEVFGDTVAIARNISSGGILVEMGVPLPLGTVVTVHFQAPREDGSVDELVARAEVKHHHILNFGAAGEVGVGAARAIGLRFLDFDDRPSLDALPSTRSLH